MGRPTDPESGYLNTAAAARLLGVTSRSVLNYCRAGRFPGAFRTGGGESRGGDWRIPRESIHSFKERSADLEALINGNHEQEDNHAD